MIKPAPKVNQIPLGLSAAALFRSSPMLYQDFIKELEAYTVQVALSIASASNEEIFILKGRAQQAQGFLRLLEEVDRSK